MDNYIVVSEYDKEKFILRVNYYIEKGYVPCGGIAIEETWSYTYYYQAMIKKEVK
jgi:hypothetical protein